MDPRFKGLSPAAILKLMNECDAEHYAESNSDCDLNYLEESLNCFVNMK